MKRLSVRPAFRRFGVRRRLVERLIEAGLVWGYVRMCLDTVPEMAAARGLYGSLGFRPTAPYCENPLPGALFMARMLAR